MYSCNLRSIARALTLNTIFMVTLCPALAWATEWVSVGPGVEYTEFHLPDPNNVFVTRMDRYNTQCILESSIGQGKVSGGAERVTGQANRYNDAISYWDQDWGQRNQVIAAVNGDFWDTSTGIPATRQIHSGWYAKSSTDYSPTFCWKLNRDAFVTGGTFLSHGVRFLDRGTSMNYDTVNVARAADQFVVFTPQFDYYTRTDSTGVEVLVEMTRPNVVTPSSDPAIGIIRGVYPNQGSTVIPFDHVVLSASGAAATTLLANAVVGERVGLYLALSGTKDWNKSFAGVGGFFLLQAAGEPVESDPTPVLAGGLIAPRTAIAMNEDYIFFVVVDGRSSISIGMDFNQLAEFCRNYLGATSATAQDGGGSSALVVNGTVMNVPSDGSERAVSNGMMMVVVQPKVQSTTFEAGDQVKTTGKAYVYLGPGTNYVTLSSVSSNNYGTVLNHHLRGIYAKGAYWWKCDFNGTIGWVTENLLTLNTTGTLPRFSEHPATQRICPAGTATFSVAATGTGTLQYQWLKHGTDLSEGGHYTGVTGPTLTVSNATATEEGSYRCIVTDDLGEATSYSAALALAQATTILRQPASQTIHILPLGADTTLTAKAYGEGTLSYQWQKDGEDIENDGFYIHVDSPTLTIANVDSRHRGQYRCLITGDCGTLISEEATLTVISADMDNDMDGDGEDFAIFQNCMGIEDLATKNPDCLKADMDNDGHVDHDDVQLLQDCLSGSHIPLKAGC